MSRLRDQTDSAVPFTFAFLIAADSHQPGIFPLCAGVRLHAHGVITGQQHQPAGELFYHHMIALRLFRRAERVHIAEFRPGNRDHLRCRIQFHGAGTERDHRLIQRQVFTGQAVQVAHHIRFAVIAAEVRMLQNFPFAAQRGRNGFRGCGNLCIQCIDIPLSFLSGQYRVQIFQALTLCGFAQGDRNGTRQIGTQVDACGFGAGQNNRFILHFNGQGIKPGGIAQTQTRICQGFRQDIGQAVNAPGNPFQTFRPVVDRIHPGDICQQNLRGTDIGVRFFTADMLFAGLQRQAQRTVTGGINGYPDKTARHRTFVSITTGKEGSMRAAVTHRYTKTLGRAEDNIRALFTRCFQQDQRHNIGCHTGDHLTLM